MGPAAAPAAPTAGRPSRSAPMRIRASRGFPTRSSGSRSPSRPGATASLWGWVHRSTQASMTRATASAISRSARLPIRFRSCSKNPAPIPAYGAVVPVPAALALAPAAFWAAMEPVPAPWSAASSGGSITPPENRWRSTSIRELPIPVPGLCRRQVGASSSTPTPPGSDTNSGRSIPPTTSPTWWLTSTRGMSRAVISPTGGRLQKTTRWWQRLDASISAPPPNKGDNCS